MIKKKIRNIILLAILVGAFVGYRMYNKPHKDVSSATVDITVTTKSLLDDFSNDEIKSNEKYLEKIVKISGVVSEMKVVKDKGIITLANADVFGSVLCHLSEEATKKMTSIEVGQTITLKGICTGYLMDVILVKCELIN
jgi:hypothetical protein